MHLRFFILIVLLCGCNDTAPPSNTFSWQEITGRDSFLQNTHFPRIPIYRAKVPSNWNRIELSSDNSIVDTTKPLYEFVIDDSIILTIHNFPSDKIEERIPPQAQVERWKRQFHSLVLTSVQVTPQAYGGFAGLFFEGEGIIKGQSSAMMAWSMQLGYEHYRSLEQACTPDEWAYLRQRRADFTLKAIGPKDAIDRHREDIIAFAHSFELIQEIPETR